jgi:hypothetical protein
MSTKENIKEFLSQNGWKSEPVDGKQERDLRMAYQNGDTRILIDHRFNREEYWLWIVNNSNKVCFGFPDDDAAMKMVEKINSDKGTLDANDSFGPYFELQSVGEVSIMAWEQFKEIDTEKPAFDLDEEIGKAQAAAAEVGAGGDLDVEVFPGAKVAKLSDYVKIMKMMQTGDMNGALASYGLNMTDWGTVAMEWGQKLAADPTLNAKMTKMLTQ